MNGVQSFVISLVTLFAINATANDGWYTEGGNYEPLVRIRLTLTNPLPVARKRCPVTVSRLDLPFTNFGPRECVVVEPSLPPRPEPTAEEKRIFGGHLPREEKNGRYIHYQCDDIDRDGYWDELFFMTDFAPNETKMVFVYVGYNNRGLYPHETFAAVADYARHPAPMWESEFMTWKLFYPTDVDIQAKRAPMLNGYYTLTSNISGYHFDEFDKGSDIMTVSTTFGGGGICLFEHSANPDSVSRPLFSPYRKTGPLHDTRFVFDVIASGPLRSIVRVHTLNWRSSNGEYELEQYYTAYADKSYSTCRVRYLRFNPGNTSTAFGCGIRRIMFEDEAIIKDGMVISIARDMPVIDPNPETVGRERATLEYAATALVVREKYAPEYRAVEVFQGNHTFMVPCTDDLTYEYLITAGWSEGPSVVTPDEFVDYVLRTSREYNNPVNVAVSGPEVKRGMLSVDYWGWDDVHKKR